MTLEPIEKIGNVTSKSVLKHTKKNWDQWVQILDKAGARKWPRKEVLTFLSKKYKVTPWWQQIIATGYEVFTGRRAPGRDAKGEYSVTVTKTLHVDQKILWKVVSSAKGMALWLAPMTPIKLAPKTPYEREDGVYGEIRTMKNGERVRFSWREGDWAKATTVQLNVFGRANGTSILVFQHERLKDGRLREPLRALWRQAIEELAAITPQKKKS